MARSLQTIDEQMADSDLTERNEEISPLRRDEEANLGYCASTQALSTPELLENILLQLPIRELLLHALLVSRYWKTTIDHSPKLQQALFLQPVPSPPLRTFTSPRNVMFWARARDDPYSYSVLKNPFYDHIRLHIKEERFQRAEGSWRRMLLTQPQVLMISQDPKFRKFSLKERMEDILDGQTFKYIKGSYMWIPVEYAHEVDLTRRGKGWWM